MYQFFSGSKQIRNSVAPRHEWAKVLRHLDIFACLRPVRPYPFKYAETIWGACVDILAYHARAVLHFSNQSKERADIIYKKKKAKIAARRSMTPQRSQAASIQPVCQGYAGRTPRMASMAAPYKSCFYVRKGWIFGLFGLENFCKG